MSMKYAALLFGLCAVIGVAMALIAERPTSLWLGLALALTSTTAAIIAWRQAKPPKE